MQPLKTVSTVERIVRNSIVTAMVLGYAGWSFYDGYVAYPADNLKAAKQHLPAEEQNKAAINPAVSSAVAAELQHGSRLSDFEKLVGPAAWKGRGEGGERQAIWFGAAGTLIVAFNLQDVITAQPQWQESKHSELDLLFQKIIGYVLGVLGLWMLVRLALMITRGATFSDAGLKPSGRALIPFDAMTGWDTSEYREKGRIHLTYLLDGEQDVYTLDDYKLAAFPEIVAEICARRGFENPIKPKPPTT